MSALAASSASKCYMCGVHSHSAYNQCVCCGYVLLPKPRSIWRHHSGTEYTVIDLTSEPDEERAKKFPVMVFYRAPNNQKWARTLSDFLENFQHVRDMPLPQNFLDANPKATGTIFGASLGDLSRDDLLHVIAYLLKDNPIMD